VIAMTAHQVCHHCDELTATIETAHERVLSAFADGDVASGIVWLSAHLAAVDRVVHPAIRRHLPRGDNRLADLKRARNTLQRDLRALEQLVAGDVHARGVVANAVVDDVHARLRGHADAEHALIDELARALGPDRSAELSGHYARALADGPTRPHIHKAHDGLAGRLWFSIDRIRDHVLDVLDSRRVPIPRQRSARRSVGRWGHYALGTMADRDRTNR
jgi:hypothetical protein